MQSFKKIFTTTEKNPSDDNSISGALSEISKIDLKKRADVLTKYLQERNPGDIDFIIEIFNKNTGYLKMLRDEHLLIFLNNLSKKNEHILLELIDNLREFYSHKNSPDVASILSDVDFSFQNIILDLIRSQNIYEFISIKDAYVEKGKLSQPAYVFLLQNTAKDYPLYIAAALNDINKMNKLIKAGADINQECWQITVLHLALACQQKEAVEFLLKNKACFKHVSHDAQHLDLLEMYTGKEFLDFDEKERPGLEHVLKFFIEKADTCVESREVLLKSIELCNKHKDKKGTERYQDAFELLAKYQLIYEIYLNLQQTKVFDKIFESTEKKIQRKDLPHPDQEPLRTQALIEIKKISSQKTYNANFLSSINPTKLNDIYPLLAICKNIDVANGPSLNTTLGKLDDLAYDSRRYQQTGLNR